MSERKEITEKMGVHEDWYEEAKEITPENLDEFIKKLTEDYNHDYGTICHACAAAAIAGATAIDNSEQGGITGFQAGCIMWEFIRKWMIGNDEQPMKLLKYEDLLYPQYGYRFNTISKEGWEWVKEQAEKNLKEESACAEVKQHWRDITNEQVPFRLKIEDK